MNVNSLPSSEKILTHLARTAAAILALALVFTLAIFAAPAAQAQTFQVLHEFTGGADGAEPFYAGLTIDAAGNLYGTTYYGGGGPGWGYGTVFELKHSGSAWIFTSLYRFADGNAGTNPAGRVALAQDGTLYGTTVECQTDCYGTVFHLRPPAQAPKSAMAPWDMTVLYRFHGSDGAYPQGDLTFDRSGSVYGTTTDGGGGQGAIYELTPSGDSWTEAVLYSPQDYGRDGRLPYGGVVFDPTGNLYGTFSESGPYGSGTVYQLSPSESGWTERTIHAFTGLLNGGGSGPLDGLILDQFGNLYGTTNGFQGGGCTVYELTPSDNSWGFDKLYDWKIWGNGGPISKLARDAAGNLYGTTYAGGAFGCGSIFKLTPSDGGWTYTSLHEFTDSDGCGSMGTLVFDSNGNLYGTTAGGGAYYWGVVFEITP